jgi:RNA polymerase sigma-70 factor (ECF subfamily)
LEEWAVADQSTPSSHVARDEQAAQVADALMQLPEEQRTVLVMKNWDGLTLDQIAQRTGKTPGSVAGLYQRGLKKLRALLDARVDDL